MRLRLALAGSLIGGLMIWACGGEETTTSPGEQQQPPAPTVASVAVTPASATLVSLGETAQLTASARDTSGNAISGKTFTWSSADESIATVDSSGLVTAVANGAATITATTDGVNGSASLTVAQVAARVTVTPVSAALSGIGTTAQLSATAYDANDSLIVTPVVTWSTLNADVVSVTPSGLATARRDGQGTIAATVDDVPGYALLTIAIPGPAPARTWERGLFQPHHIAGIWGSGSGDVWTVGVVGACCPWAEGKLAHYDGIAWRDETPGLMRSQPLDAVWGSGPGDVWAVGEQNFGGFLKGLVLRFDGANWTNITPDVITGGTLQTSLETVWGSGSNDVWVGGLNGIFHYDGTMWTEAGTGWVHGIWGTSTSNVWAVGPRGKILHYDGTTWSQTANGLTGKHLFGVWGSGPSDVWTVGEDGIVLHFDGASWTVTIGPPPNPAPQLEAVWGTDSANIWAVGKSGKILQFDGTAWIDVSPGVPSEDPFNSVWGTGPTDIWAGGAHGLLYHYDGTSWSAAGQGGIPAQFAAVWGSSGSDLWAVGIFNRSFGISGILVHYDGSTWTDRTEEAPGAPFDLEELTDIWGTGSTQAWAVGYRTILRYDGAGWDTEGASLASFWPSVWGSSPHDVWVVGSTGAALHYDGTEWTNAGFGGGVHAEGVWGTAPNDVWVVGLSGKIMHFDGTGWTDMSVAGITAYLQAVWGSGPSDVWAVGRSGTILHYDGNQWSDVSPVGSFGRLLDVRGTGPADVWVVGTPAVSPPTLPIILHYDGSKWTDVTPPLTTSNLNAIFGSRSGDIWVLGDHGIVLRGR